MIEDDEAVRPSIHFFASISLAHSLLFVIVASNLNGVIDACFSVTFSFLICLFSLDNLQAEKSLSVLREKLIDRLKHHHSNDGSKVTDIVQQKALMTRLVDECDEQKKGFIRWVLCHCVVHSDG